MVSRALSLSFYIFYLITLAIALWFLLHYSGVQSWVWIFFGIAILIAIIGALMREFLLVRTVTPSGTIIYSNSLKFWLILYVIFHITALILIIVGIVLVIRYSTIPWWVWVVLAIAIFLSIISNMILAFSHGSYIFAIIIFVIALILFIAGVVLLIIYSHVPLWVWLIIGLAVFFAILSVIFDGMADRNKVILQEGCVYPVCPPRTFLITPPTTPVITTVPVSTSPVITLSNLPGGAYPEQIVD